MSVEMWITLIILVAAIVLFVTEWLRVDVVALCVLIALLATNILTTEEAVAGFSSTSVISIGSLFIVGGAVFHTGLAASIGERILKIAGTNETRLIATLMIAVAVLSSFISSTGVVALMLPAVISLARSVKIPASRLLMPLAFSALLGGSATLIGTPPNIIVSEALQKAGYAPFDLFSFSVTGVVLIIAGVIYVLMIGRRLLPTRVVEQTVHRMETPTELFVLYQLPNNLFRLHVQGQSPLVNETIANSHLGHDYGVSIVSIGHNGNSATSEARQMATVHTPSPSTVIRTGDVLVVQGDLSNVTAAAGRWNLGIVANEPVVENDVITNEVGIAELILRPRSSLNGKTLVDVRFGSTYRLTVLNLRRPGVDEPLDIKTTPLKFGDVLLIQGRWKDIFALKRLRHDFIVMGEPEAAEFGAFMRKSHAPITLIVLGLMIVAIALNIMSLTLASMLAALAIVLTGCLTMDEAYDSIDWRSLFLIAGMLPMSTALVKVGLVDLIASTLVTTVGAWGPLFVLAGLFILTATLTQVISNTATALLIAPIALAAGQGLGVEPHAFLMMVAIAASMAFASPIASPVNTLVMSAGNYRFLDYTRVGALMVFISFLITMVVLPILWPF